MIEAKNSGFKFLDYKVLSFSYDTPDNENKEAIRIDFEPSGIYKQKTGTFALQLMFRGTEDKEGGKTFMQVKAEAIFKFQDNFPFKDLPDFFYKNAIAILFPYLRAFISNMTLQANAPIVILTVMNLGNLEQPLKDATTSIEE